MKRLFIITLLALACSAREDAPPSDVLPRDRFKEVLLEAQLLEARMSQELTVAHVGTIPSEQYYEELFKAKGTTKDEFRRSFAYWSGRSEDMKEIYEEILAELGRRKDEQPQ